MSYRETSDPVVTPAPTTPAIETIIDARPRDLGGFVVGRVLPSTVRRMVGPFIFFDHMGPAELATGQAIDVRPHPHINLATVTYLFEGEIMHRDSLGSEQPIRPGAINWMTAGRGIAHSERTPPELRGAGSRLHGIQLWVALPKVHEETQPDFRHYPSDGLPTFDRDGVRVRVLAGSAYQRESPVATLSPLFYVDAVMPPGTELELPEGHAERAAYVVEGVIHCGAVRAAPRRMLVFATGSKQVLQSETQARVVLLGGAPLDGPRYIWWNFVSSSHERIEEAKRAWKEGRFPKVVGDEEEFIPLPEG
jgi:redox-sensitive bicupin YhaK (pirin superfamily)